MAWKGATGEIVYPSEYAILCAIDEAFCDEMNKELVDFRKRQADQAQKIAPNAKGKGR